jgi:hypothetical protein
MVRWESGRNSLWQQMIESGKELTFSNFSMVRLSIPPHL